MKHLLLTLMALTVCLTVSAQKTDKVYEEAKALYEAKNYEAAVPKLKIAAEKGKKGLKSDQKKAKSLLTKALKDEKHGDKLLKKLRQDAKEGDEDAKAILQLTGKKL